MTASQILPVQRLRRYGPDAAPPLRVLATVAALLFSFAAAAQTQFHIATTTETRQLLAADDDWMAAVGSFNRAAIAGRPDGISRTEFKTAVQAAAIQCPTGDVQRWRAMLDSVATRYERLHMRLPATVNIACIDGTVAGGEVYTRGNTMFVPRAMGARMDEWLFAHELFHIFSRHNPVVPSRLYAQLGFTEVPALQWPEEWIEARILNPDAPFDRHSIRIETSSGPYSVMPVLVARRTVLQPGETFFNVLDVRLLAVQPSPRRQGQPSAAAAGQATGLVRCEHHRCRT